MSESTNTWADGFGRWHATVSLTDCCHCDAHAARKLIVAELVQREAPNWDPRTVHVTRTAVTDTTVTYSEVWN